MKNKMVLMTIALCTMTILSQAAPQKGDGDHKACKDHKGHGEHGEHRGQREHRGDRGHGNDEDKVKKETPLVVTQAFQKDFPTITKMHWEDEKGDFEAKFKQNGFRTSAVYDSTGYKKALEVEINTNELPAKSQEYLKKNYPNTKIDEASIITNAKNMVTFEAEIDVDGKDTDILFDANGTFVK